MTKLDEAYGLKSETEFLRSLCDILSPLDGGAPDVERALAAIRVMLTVLSNAPRTTVPELGALPSSCEGYGVCLRHACLSAGRCTLPTTPPLTGEMPLPEAANRSEPVSATQPLEPTQAMIDAGRLAIEQGRGAKSVWLEMASRAPASTSGQRTGRCGAFVEGLIEHKYCDREFGHPGGHSHRSGVPSAIGTSSK